MLISIVKVEWNALDSMAGQHEPARPSTMKGENVSITLRHPKVS